MPRQWRLITCRSSGGWTERWFGRLSAGLRDGVSRRCFDSPATNRRDGPRSMYRLIRTAERRSEPPLLDESQRAVVAHEGGPLLVLAGPGTGKTTTMVESVVELVERRGVDPSQILALTFSRKAAEQLRDRVTARLGRTLGTSLAATFHSFAYSLVRQHAPKD